MKIFDRFPGAISGKERGKMPMWINAQMLMTITTAQAGERSILPISPSGSLKYMYMMTRR